MFLPLRLITKIARPTTPHAPPAAIPKMAPRGSPSSPESGGRCDKSSSVSGSEGGDGGGEGEGGAATTILGTDTTVMPSAAEAAAAVPRLEESVVCTVTGVVEAGTAIMAVMSTLAAATVTVTAEASTAATAAIELCRAVVSV